MATTLAYYKNFGDLKTEILTYCEDDTTEFTEHIDGIVNRALDKVCGDLNLELFVTWAPFEFVNGTAEYARPVGAKLDCIIFADGGVVERRSSEFIRMYGGTGRPRWFGELSAAEIIVAPTPDNDYSAQAKTLTRFAALELDEDTNWVLENAGDLVLYTALIESEAFLFAPERIAEFKQLYAQGLLTRGHELRELQRVEYTGGKGVVAEQTAKP